MSKIPKIHLSTEAERTIPVILDENRLFDFPLFARTSIIKSAGDPSLKISPIDHFKPYRTSAKLEVHDGKI